MLEKYSEKILEAHKNLISTYDKVNTKGITVLTGNNGSGKSLIRKQLPFIFQKELGLDSVKETKGMIQSISMDARTNSNPEFGGLSGILNDTSWVATSQNTFNIINGLFSSIENSSRQDSKYLVIDEYEIGCSEETIISLALFISNKLNNLIEKGLIEGAMIITHSKVGLEHIKFDHFLNVEGKTFEEWVNRKIIPTNLEELNKNELFSLIRDKQKS